ncbi:DUF3159 domain-containing protein [Ruania alba]|uniref:DUF3159 domain-containing protein n=1 Tax=Ruania alba TaxID=648782 RepID=A0A1H5FK69_9MICO|nr:DUF3159 domain-containing protein [Ruania alba]SEE03805.1 Protein of unknown function [Ruania alba]
MSTESTGAEPDPGIDTDEGAVVDAQPDQTAPPGRGVRQLTATEFNLAESVGGVRGLVETIAPGLVFVVIFVATRDLMPALVASVSVAVVASIARLIGRTPLTQAISGLVGVAIGAVWAWRSGEASDFFAWGLIVNIAFAVGVLISILVRWPVVGVLVATLTGQDTSWRTDRTLRRRYAAASWLWFGAFAARLAVQGPLYLNAAAGWLGTARLVMGVPMWALVLWITWLWVRPRGDAAESPDPPDRPR